jgi:hypothetical protein
MGAKCTYKIVDGQKVTITDDEKIQILRAHADEGLKDVAKLFGVSAEVVGNWYERYRVPRTCPRNGPSLQSLADRMPIIFAPMVYIKRVLDTRGTKRDQSTCMMCRTCPEWAQNLCTRLINANHPLLCENMLIDKGKPI